MQPREFGQPAQRSAELLQAGVGQLHLGLDARRTADAEVISVLREIAKQSRLPDAGFPLKHENASPALSSPVKQGRQPSLFLAASQQFMMDGTESEGVVPGMLDTIAGHAGTPPPTA